ncbi:MAG: transcriptional regulator [Acidobacteria bacterium]|nr:MAG: transcriptional regulator [Acidobacteriota bacterium]
MRSNRTIRKRQGAFAMRIGARLRQLREKKGLSQGDIEAATGLLRCYTSRVENGHTVPSLETLERFASALEIPLYMLFYEGDAQPELTPRPPLEHPSADGLEPQEREDGKFLLKLRSLLGSIAPTDRESLLATARRMASQ